MRVPVLTIAYHPDLRRIGEQCRLVSMPLGKGLALSRLEPMFSQPGVTLGRPIADSRISRRPVFLERSDQGGIRVDASGTSISVKVDGVDVDGIGEVSRAQVEQGAVIELAKRFVLILHSVGRPHERTPDLGLVGANEEIARLRGDILRVGDLDVPVLLRGESGTGKELVAKAIHSASHRRSSECVIVNMAAINRTTAASELFGHVRGAFTGANRDHDGYFSRAHGGTLFMDEIGGTPAELQVMLLRVLEMGEIQPVGATRTRRVDVRLIAATDADLEAATRDGSFKLPLLHRLAGYQLNIPPLRARRDDIPRLFIYFLGAELEKLGEGWRLQPNPMGGEPWLPADLMARLVRYGWPGNVRQLRNVARQLVISSRGANTLRVDPSVERLLSEEHHVGGPDDSGMHTVVGNIQGRLKTNVRLASGVRKRPGEITEPELIEALKAHNYRLGPTAKDLGMSRTTLYALIDKSPNIRKARDLTEEQIQAVLSDDVDVAGAAESLEVSARGLQLRMKELGLT